jgi:iron complex outermembrane receptor protein
MEIQPFFKGFLKRVTSPWVSSVFRLWVAGLVFWGSPFVSFAKGADLTEMSLEELMDVRIKPVISASKYEQKSMEAPSSMSVVTAEDIERYGYRTLGDLLQGVRGFYITQDRNYSYAGFRGFNRPGDYSTRILLLLDGVRVNDNIFDSAAIGADFILDLDLIQRVEIVRGPSYAIYGNNAFFVVVNVISKDADDMKGMESSVEAGSFDTVKGRVSLGKVFHNQDRLILSGSILDSRGQNHYFPEFDTPDWNNGLAEDCDEENAGNLFFKYSRSDFALEGAYVKRSKQIPTGAWGTVFNDPRNKAWDERAFLDLKMERGLTHTLDMLARLTYGFYTYEGTYSFLDEAAQAPYINRDDDKGQWWGCDFHLVHKAGKHTLLAGGEYRDHFTLNQKNFDESGDVYLQDRRKTRNWGLFIQDEFAVLPNLKLNAGVRYDDYSTFGGTTNPRIALIYRPVSHTSFKYLAGTAFRAPNSYELFYNDGDYSQKANPGLDEERITSHEWVWEQILGEHYSTALSLYSYRIENLISLTTDADDLLVFINQDEVEAHGVEAEIMALFGHGIKGNLSYALQKSDFKHGSLPWTNSPRHLAKSSLAVPLFNENLYLGIEEQYTGTLETIAGGAAGDYFMTHLTLQGKEMIKNLDVSASLYNLFDESYSFPGSDEHVQDKILQDGRNFRLKLTWRF